jgi:hypothetical protein
MSLKRVMMCSKLISLKNEYFLRNQEFIVIFHKPSFWNDLKYLSYFEP